MKFKKWLIDNFDWLLANPGEQRITGPEQGQPVDNGISEFKDPYGSTRLVKYVDGEPIAAIQIISTPKKNIISQIYTHPNYRRQGIATELLGYAQNKFPNLQHSPEYKNTKDGLAWIDSLK